MRPPDFGTILDVCDNGGKSNFEHDWFIVNCAKANCISSEVVRRLWCKLAEGGVRSATDRPRGFTGGMGGLGSRACAWFLLVYSGR